MHDCQATKARLVDLIFDDAGDAELLRSEVRSCAACAAEYRALSETFRAFDRAAGEARPPEEFWPGYHARLARRLDAAALAAPPAPGAALASARVADASPPTAVARLRRALAARWSVPAPLALAALLLIVCLTPFALRPTPVVITPTPRANDPAPAANESPSVRTIEVPVIHEKVVTRKIYVTRPARRRERTPPAGDTRAAAGPTPDAVASAPNRDMLTGFQPSGDVRMRVIKGSFEDER
jgi:hypothetical protein